MVDGAKVLGVDERREVRDLAVLVALVESGNKLGVGVAVVAKSAGDELLVPPKPENPPNFLEPSWLSSGGGGGIAATEARLGRPRILMAGYYADGAKFHDCDSLSSSQNRLVGLSEANSYLFLLLQYASESKGEQNELLTCPSWSE